MIKKTNYKKTLQVELEVVAITIRFSSAPNIKTYDNFYFWYYGRRIKEYFKSQDEIRYKPIVE